MFRRCLIPFVITLALIALVLPGAALAQPRTYLALGDSYGFGFETGDASERSAGDRGYVRPYADWLTNRPGFAGQRPRIVNLSVPGETVGSFFNASQPGSIYNTNYPVFGRTSQASVLSQRISSEAAAGRTISHVSISMGGNDLLALRSDASFPALSIADQQQRVVSTLNAMANGYTSILTQIRAQLPAAELLVVGYFNPFPAVPGNAFAPISQFAIDQMNARIAQVTLAVGGPNARFIDIAPRFVGNEAAWSYITAPQPGDNIHPNTLGYAQISQAIIIPNPAAGWLLLTVVTPLAIRRRAA